MNQKPKIKPLIVIIGPTASGKTALALKLAKRYNGEIISADSRAIYRYLDIGTAKPTEKEQDGVPHWGIDLVDPNQSFSVADFQHYAKTKITEIRSRGKMPFLVGGSGLYVDAVIFDYQFPTGVDCAQERMKYNKMSLTDIISYCEKNNIDLPENYKNKRYVINQIVRRGCQPTKRSEVIDNCLVFGIKVDRNELRERIGLRAESMFQDGVIEEAKKVAASFGWEHESMTGVIYPLIRQYLEGEIDLKQTIELFKQSDLRLVKKQLTWFRRYHNIINWVELKEAERSIVQKIDDVLKCD